MLGVRKDTEQRYHGKRSWDFDVEEQGWRYHMSNINAAIGIAQLDSCLDKFRYKKLLSDEYIRRLKDINQIELLDIFSEDTVNHIFPILVKANIRDKLREFLLHSNIETGVHYKPNHKLSFYKSNYQLPIAEELSNRVISLPFHSLLTLSELNFIVEKILIFLKLNPSKMESKKFVEKEKEYCKVSVIINVFNGEKYIKKAIESILNQEIYPSEIIIWDNCSIDKTQEIINNYSEVKYFRSEKHTPLGEARELARKVAKEDWVAYLDCDDYWYPQKLKDQIRFINDDVGLIYSGVDEIDEKGKLIQKRLPLYKSGWMLEKQLERFDINMVTPLINNKLIKNYNFGFNKEMFASEEQDLFLKICSVSKIVTIFEIHGVSKIREKSLTNEAVRFWSIERNRTLDDIVSIIKTDKYDDALQKARMQAIYYEARYYAMVENYKEVRKIMKKLIKYRKSYFLLYIVSFFPFIWNLIHKRSLKAKLTKIFKINE